MSGLGSASVIRANARHLPLADDSVDLVVTSPPYFALRSYQDGGEHYEGQIGDEPTPAEFVASLLEVTAECVRVLKPSGSLWVNLGDKYAGSGAGGPQNGASDRAGRRSAGTQGAMPVTDVRAKSLIGIPWRYALACIDGLGLILRAEVIWSKPNGLPESVTDRVRRSHEQWFHFTLEPRYFSAVDEIREGMGRPPTRGERVGGTSTTIGPADAEGGAFNRRHDWVPGPNPLGKLPGSVWTIPTEPLRVPDSLGIDHFAAFPTEWPKRIIAGWSPAGVCVECGEGRRPVVSTTHERLDGWRPGFGASTRMDRRAPGSARPSFAGEITAYVCGCPARTWETSPDSGICAECDTPSDWADSCSQGCETPGLPPTRPAVVLDPFGGTGTTAMVAKALGRHGITVDMSSDYCRLADWRVNDRNQLAKVLGHAKTDAPDEHQLDLFGEATA